MSARLNRLPMAVSTLTPLRISFAGGGTDLPFFYEKHDGAVISSAIDKFIHVMVKRHNPIFKEAYRLNYSKTESAQSLECIENNIARECLRLIDVEPPLYIATAADLPTSAGLGSSSSFAVGLLHALHLLKGERVTSAQLAEEACEIEINILGNPIGKQDQYSAAFGGLNHIYFKKCGQVDVDKLMIPADLIHQLFQNSLLIWTGIQRSASTILKKQNDGMEMKIQEYQILSKVTNEIKDLILNPTSNFLENFGGLIEKGWDIKKSLEGSISFAEIDTMHSQLEALGSYGGKLSGAGGGGFLYELIAENFHEDVMASFGKERVIKIAHEPLGSRQLSEIY
jgi:D-glycero-alpha-D-manno-heptose-7-phosphate kinase